MGEEVNYGTEREVRSGGRGGRAGEGGRRAHRDVPFVYQFSRLWLSYAQIRSVSTPLQRIRLVNHADHVQLLEKGINRDSGGVWVDFGAGSGAFTLALRDIAGPDTAIIAIDRDRASLQMLRATMERLFPGTRLRLLQADMAGHLTLPPLDGIVAANAIHFVPLPDQTTLLRRWRSYLKPEGRLIVIEYDADSGNRWAPYPMSYAAFRETARAAGFTEPELLGSRPSQWLGRIYSALTRPILVTAPPSPAPGQSVRTTETS
jgi:ubiquinone/menaquinone biosynthesis C-methylase UbiE